MARLSLAPALRAFPLWPWRRAWCSVRSGPRAGGGTGAPLTLCRPARVLGVSQWACGPALPPAPSQHSGSRAEMPTEGGAEADAAGLELSL